MKAKSFCKGKRSSNHLKKHVKEVNQISHTSENHNCCGHGPVKNYTLVILHSKGGEKQVIFAIVNQKNILMKILKHGHIRQTMNNNDFQPKLFNTTCII